MCFYESSAQMEREVKQRYEVFKMLSPHPTPQMLATGEDKGHLFLT